jgi:hypothetical protein
MTRWRGVITHITPEHPQHDALMAMVTGSPIDPGTGCWVWGGIINAGGYGRVNVAGLDYRRQLQAHRVAYELFKGEIPDTYQVDHLCRNRRCVNPNHLEAVTQHENILRSEAPAAINARKTHCKRGHDLADAYITSAGGRQCRVCKRDAERAKGRAA